MARELTYVAVNPYTIYKSRTGGILSRLLTRTALDLVGAVMIAPDQAFVDAYAETIVTDKDPARRAYQEQIRDYVKRNYAPDASGRPNRIMVLLFEGEDAVRKTLEAVGSLRGKSGQGGETIRDTYGDLIANPDGTLRYFEPAVLVAPTAEDAQKQLRLMAKHVAAKGPLLENATPTAGQPGHQRTLVIIKPDNFRFPSGRPGNVMDLFSRAGLYIAGVKVHRMSVEQAEEFYGPVRQTLLNQLREPTAQRAKELLESALSFSVGPETLKQLGEILGPLAGEDRFQTIVKFMAGRAPRDCATAAEKKEPGSEKCIVLIYEGIDAVKKIREVLGPTDPSKAPPGSIRREFGQTIMVNAAHASDSAENARREMEIVRIQENNFKALIDEAYGS
ncbi:MAG: nucleoside-diphosphate kinase [Verrucomicrobium sp.]|nr:nucleoside-diphosphate kinase [Verrucomicrobium sp.]